MDRLFDQLERVRAGIRTRAEYPFRVVKRQFDPAEVSYRGLAKNTAQWQTRLALANLWLVLRKVIGAVA